MKKRKLTLASLVIAIGLVAAGCGSSASQTPAAEAPAPDSASPAASTAQAPEPSDNAGGAPVEVSFWTLSSRQEGVEQIVEEFNATQSAVKVTASYYDTDGIKDACKIGASSGTLPDMWFNWGGSLGGFYVNNGLTYDMTAYASANGWNDKFDPNALALCTYDGKLSGYPTSYNILSVYYKKSIFEANQIEVPATFEEFEAVCAKLKAAGVTPITTGGLYGWHTMRFIELAIEHYAGAKKHDQMSSFAESYDDPTVVEALKKYQEFCEKGYFPTGFVTQDPNDTFLALATDAAAMDIQGQWYDGTIIQNGKNPADYGVFAFPSGGTNRLSSFAEMTQFNKNLSDEKLAACVAFMDYYYTQENVDKYGEYFNLPLPLKGAKMPEGQPNVAVAYALGEKNQTFTITDQAFPTEVCDVLFKAQDAIANGQMKPEEAAKNIQDAIVAYTNK